MFGLRAVKTCSDYLQKLDDFGQPGKSLEKKTRWTKKSNSSSVLGNGCVFCCILFLPSFVLYFLIAALSNYSAFQSCKSVLIKSVVNHRKQNVALTVLIVQLCFNLFCGVNFLPTLYLMLLNVVLQSDLWARSRVLLFWQITHGIHEFISCSNFWWCECVQGNHILLFSLARLQDIVMVTLCNRTDHYIFML